MNKIDEVIKETMKTEYENITPDVDKLITATKQEYNNSLKKGKVKWKKYVAVAATFVIMISAARSTTIKAFLLDIYERYFARTQQMFEQNTEDYIKNLNLEYDVDGEKVIIKQYVVTNRGIDFKIYQDKDSKTKICGCEIKLKNGESYDEMVVHLEDYYIVSNIVESENWTKDNLYAISLLYAKEGDDNVYAIEKNAELDMSDIYCNKTVKGKPFIIDDDKYVIRQMTFATWYMKVDYDVNKPQNSDYVPMMKQNGEEITYLTAVQNKSGFSAYYQLPKLNEPMQIAIGKINYNKNTIDEMSEYMDLELKNILKEEK